MYILILKGAVIESGSSSSDGSRVNAPDGIELTLYIYRKSYSNKPIAGTGAVVICRYLRPCWVHTKAIKHILYCRFLKCVLLNSVATWAKM